MGERRPVALPRGTPTILLVGALLYLGMLIGVSFVATPAKFLAASLSRPQALEVGRYTFGVFGWVELLSAAGLLWLGRRTRRRGIGAISSALLAAVMLQMTWIRPVLDERVSQYLAGGIPPPSGMHYLYVVLELFKCGLLVALAWQADRLGDGPARPRWQRGLPAR